MNAWIVCEQRYFEACGSNNVVAVFSTKKKAEAFCRNDGFKYEANQRLFCNETWQKYRRVDGFKMNQPDSAV